MQSKVQTSRGSDIAANMTRKLAQYYFNLKHDIGPLEKIVFKLSIMRCYKLI